MSKATVLCVDDEPLILEGLSRTLGRKYDVLTATSGRAALEILKKNRLVAVVISDMRMAGMDGAALLAKVRESNPFTVRLLLTGQSSLDAAINAINQGQIFRFLLKPIPPNLLLTSLEAAMAQHRLLLSERVLLEQTLRGSIKLLTELLSLSNPLAFGRAERIKQKAVELVKHLQLESIWQIEVATMLSHIGYITLSQVTVEKIYHGFDLNPGEEAQLIAMPSLCESLLANIPRLEEVRAILFNQRKNYDGSGLPDNGLSGEQIPLGSRILKILFDFDTFEAQGQDLGLALESMRARQGHYDLKLIEEFSKIRGTTLTDIEIRHLALGDLQIGMQFAEDVRTATGLLVIPRGSEVTETLLERIRNFSGLVEKPVPMIIPKRPTSPPSASIV